ncbi:hypothetical protein [Amycolatopsis sp. WAC 01375]|nr:hypothetical protein [Amycolatopsis sp. WAC 01375]
MTVIVSSAELPEPTDTDFHGSGAAAWNIAGRRVRTTTPRRI